MNHTSMTHGKLIDILKKQKPKVKVYMSLGFVEVKRTEIIQHLSKYNPLSTVMVELKGEEVLLR